MNNILIKIDIFFLLLYNISIIFILSDINFIELEKKNRRIFTCSIFFILSLNIYILFMYGVSFYFSYSPICVYLLLFMSFWRVSKHRGFKLLFIILSSIIWTAPLLLLSNTIVVFFKYTLLMKLLIHLIAFIPFLFIINHYFKPHHKYMLENKNSGWAFFCIIPSLCILDNYISNLISIKNTVELSKQINIWRFSFNILIFSSYMLIINNFKQIKKGLEIENEVELINTQLYGATQYINSLKNSQVQATIYYHDLRHHLQLINSYALSQDYDSINEYISTIQKNIDVSTATSFCKNDTINLILSAFNAKAKNENIRLIVKGNLSNDMGIPETDFCVLISNAIENAIKATKQISNRLKEVKVLFYTKNNQIFLEVRNPYEGEIIFENGIPKTTNQEVGHGIGTKSISLIVEKHGGIYNFETAMGEVILHVII